MASMWRYCLLFAHFPICLMAEKDRSVCVGDVYFLCHLAFSIETAVCYNRTTMAQHPTALTLSSNQPLIGIPFEENGQEVVRFCRGSPYRSSSFFQRDQRRAQSRRCVAWSWFWWDDARARPHSSWNAAHPHWAWFMRKYLLPCNTPKTIKAVILGARPQSKKLQPSVR